MQLSGLMPAATKAGGIIPRRRDSSSVRGDHQPVLHRDGAAIVGVVGRGLPLIPAIDRARQCGNAVLDTHFHLIGVDERAPPQFILDLLLDVRVRIIGSLVAVSRPFRAEPGCGVSMGTISVVE